MALQLVVVTEWQEHYTVIPDLLVYDLDSNAMDRETVGMAIADMVAVLTEVHEP